MASDIADRLLARSAVDPDTGCRRWTGGHDGHGYGQIAIKRRPVRVHVLAYKLWVGPIPDGYEIDHVHARGCRFFDCFEPSHLEAVTHAENGRRWKALITHCPQGHEYSPENTWHRPLPSGGTSRQCRTCHRERERQRWRKRVSHG